MYGRPYDVERLQPARGAGRFSGHGRPAPPSRAALAMRMATVGRAACAHCGRARASQWAPTVRLAPCGIKVNQI